MNIDIIKKDLQIKTDKYLRLKAEFENYKKRIQNDTSTLVKYANERLIQELLPILDHLEQALTANNKNANIPILKGIQIVLKQLFRILNKFGLKLVLTIHANFDPTIHEAIAVIANDTVNDNTILQEFQKGYTLNNRLIRASKVLVSKKN